MSRQRGFSLMEVMMVVAVAGVLTAVVMAAQSNNRDIMRAAQLGDFVASVRGVAVSALRSDHPEGPYYRVNDAIIQARLPATWVSGGAYRLPVAGVTATVVPVYLDPSPAPSALANTHLQITLTGVPAAVCAPLVQHTMAQFDTVLIGGNVAKDVETNQRRTAGEIASLCTAASITIIWRVA